MVRFATPRCVATSLATLITLLGANSAAAATADIGAVAEVRSGQAPSAITSGGFAVQIAQATGNYAVPPGYTTITAWSHSAGTTAGVLTFKVYRPTGGLREFTVVASDTRSVTAGAVQTFPVRIAVLPGDRIGLSSDDVELAFETFSAGDRIGFFGAELPVGATGATDGEPFPEYKLDVAATLSDGAQPGTGAPAGTPAPAPGPAPGPGAQPALPPPVLQRLTLAPRAFAAARSGASTRAARLRRQGAKVTVRVDRAATVLFTVQRVAAGRRTGRGSAARCAAPSRRNRGAPRCTRYVAVRGSFSRAVRAGESSFHFTGRVGDRTLARGSYRLMATPTANGVSGRSLTRRFRIGR